MSVVRFHQRVAQRVVLEPYGLTFDTFLVRQKDLHQSHLQQMTSQIDGCRPNIEILVAGVDEQGAHIYEVQRWGTLRSADASGFGAIGGGRRHAESEFMFDRHNPFREFPESCLLTYSAKKRAEVAPGVGHETDMFAVLGLGGFTLLGNSVVAMVNRLYEGTESIQIKARDAADEKIRETLQAIVDAARSNPTKPAEQESVASTSEASAGESDLSSTNEGGSGNAGPSDATDGSPDT